MVHGPSMRYWKGAEDNVDSTGVILDQWRCVMQEVYQNITNTEPSVIKYALSGEREKWMSAEEVVMWRWMNEVVEYEKMPESTKTIYLIGKEEDSSTANFGFMPGCPDCGAPLVMSEGCIACKSCGFNRCS